MGGRECPAKEDEKKWEILVNWEGAEARRWESKEGQQDGGRLCFVR